MSTVLKPSLEQKMESVVQQDTEERGFIVTSENLSEHMTALMSYADDVDIDDIQLKHDFILKLPGVSRESSNSDILIAISQSSEYYGAHLAYMAIREGSRDIDEIIKLVDLMEAKAKFTRDANVLNQPIHVFNWMDPKPPSIIRDINQREDEMGLMTEPLPHHPILLFSENTKSSIELPSSQQSSSSPPKVVCTSTEVPGDNVDSPLSYPYPTEQLEENYDLHFDDYTAVMYENAENNLKSVPEQQRFYGLVNSIGSVDHTPGTTLTLPLGNNLDSLLSNPYYDLPEDQEDDLFFDIDGFVNDPRSSHPRPTSTSVSGDSEGSNHSYPLSLGLEETGNP